jgi:hypothetical protein
MRRQLILALAETAGIQPMVPPQMVLVVLQALLLSSMSMLHQSYFQLQQSSRQSEQQ